jgi:hypothetical protein
MTAPDWLTRRGAGLRLGSDQRTWYVTLEGAPHYSLIPVPVGDTFGCAIKQTVNGQRIDSTGTYPSKEEAVRGGLDDLGTVLGWR